MSMARLLNAARPILGLSCNFNWQGLNTMLLFNENASQSYRDRKLEISTERTKPRPPNQIAYCLYERNAVNLYTFCSPNIQRKDRTSTQQLFFFFFSLFHQRADDEALTRFLQTSLFLVASPILVKSMFLSFRSSLTLSIQVFLCLPLLLFPSTCPCKA